MSNISYENNFYVLRYAHVRYVKSLFYKHSETIEQDENQPYF